MSDEKKAAPKASYDLKELLHKTASNNGSDLHLTVGAPPSVRVRGQLAQLGSEKLRAKDTERFAREILNARQIEALQKQHSVDLAVSISGAGRFRVAVYWQKGAITIAFRLLGNEIKTFKELGMPPAIGKLAQFKNGLALVTGPTGSGKSTTLATVIDMINRGEARVIITVEDPIEYIHFNQKCIVNQREVGADVDGFSAALRAALRADPDVILVGEMRDLDTTRTAIMAAETGHLVFSTLHSRDCSSSLNRIIGIFGETEQVQIRHQLSTALKAVVSQLLLPRRNAEGRVPATEIMFINTAIANLVRQGKPEQIYSSLETGLAEGMQTMEQSLAFLYQKGLIDREVCVSTAKNRTNMENRLKQMQTGQ